MSAQPNNASTATNPVGRFMVAVGGIIEHSKTGKILVIQRAANLDWQPGQWEVCYGRIDQFEDAETGLKREMKEELGLTDLTIKQIISCWHIYRGPKKAENELIGITYYCTTDTNSITLSNEHSAFNWVTPEEALQLIQVDGIRKDIERYLVLKKNTQTVVGTDVIGVGVGALIFNQENKLLLALRGPKAKNEVGKWEIPGGSVEYGERIKEGLQREIKEELGIEIEVGEMLQLCDHIIAEEQQHWVSPTYLCTVISGTPTIMEPEKCAEIGWFSLEEASKLPLSQVTAEDIRVLAKQHR